LILVGFVLALVMPSAAFAGGNWGGFDSDELKANIQSSIQAATVNQSGASFGGDASADGGSHNDASAWAGNGGNANSGVQGASQSNGNGTTVTTGDASTGSIDGGNTVSLGNEGGSVANSNGTDVGVDATNVAKSGDAEGANGGVAIPVNVNHEGDNTSTGGQRLQLERQPALERRRQRQRRRGCLDRRSRRLRHGRRSGRRCVGGQREHRRRRQR
jgi:hypothetical protein